MVTFVRNFFVGNFLPENISGLPVETQNGELMDFRRGLTAHAAAKAAAARAAASATATRSPAKLPAVQSRIQAVAEFFFGQCTGLFADPITKPFGKGTFEFIARQAAVFVAVGHR